MSVKQAVILVGGEGTRLGDALRFAPAVEIPKPLQEVGGKPFLTLAINMLKGIGFDDIVLLVGYKKEMYEKYTDRIVRLVETTDDVNQAVLAIPNLRDLFLLLNGDCFPIMDWRHFCNTEEPRTAIKIVERDAGVAIVYKKDVKMNRISCSNIKEMELMYESYTILGGLHIGTPQGLQRARVFADTVIYGQ